ncbi:hypothetical protein DACRYDRAFT_60748, partial [Dacryopinax primogenitus]
MASVEEEWTGFKEDVPEGPEPAGPSSPRLSEPEDSLLPGTVGHLPSFPSAPHALSSEALQAFNQAQERAGVVYISRIPPGMQPAKVRHLLSGYGEVGRVYLQQEDPKRAYLRRKYTSTKKAHYTEGWVEFTDKKVARAVAELLNAQPLGGKKSSRWRDDVWTMKYLPRFKWGMLTEQIVHERAVHRDRLRQELSQSRMEQREYLKQVELARVLDKRAERKRKRAELGEETSTVQRVEKPRREREK